MVICLRWVVVLFVLGVVVTMCGCVYGASQVCVVDVCVVCVVTSD